VLRSNTATPTPGLEINHVYSILDVQDVKIKNLERTLLLLRDPYGRGEWKGEFSNDNQNWTNELRTRLEYDNRQQLGKIEQQNKEMNEDKHQQKEKMGVSKTEEGEKEMENKQDVEGNGIFWLSKEEFLSSFSSYQACTLIDPSWKRTVLEVECPFLGYIGGPDFNRNTKILVSFQDKAKLKTITVILTRKSRNIERGPLLTMNLLVLENNGSGEIMQIPTTIPSIDCLEVNVVNKKLHTQYHCFIIPCLLSKDSKQNISITLNILTFNQVTLSVL